MRSWIAIGVLCLGACDEGTKDTDTPTMDDTAPDTTEPTDDTGTPTTPTIGYEVWGSDQSNSVPGVASRGIDGSYLWIWDSADIEAQLLGGAAATPLSCGPSDGGVGPCDLHDLFRRPSPRWTPRGPPPATRSAICPVSAACTA